MEKICGIYCIQNIRNSKRYIGYSVDIKIRWSDHRCDLKYNRHDNDYLQASYNKYGLENFVIYLIEECDKSKLKEREIYYIQYFDSANKSIGYNLTKGGDGIVGVERSKEWGDNISKGNKGRTFTKEHKENLRIAHLGYVAPQSQRDNLAIAVSGKKKAKNTSSKYVGVAKEEVMDPYANPIGGLVGFGDQITHVWVDDEYRGDLSYVNMPNLYKELLKFAKSRGIVGMAPEDATCSKCGETVRVENEPKKCPKCGGIAQPLTSKSFRASQAKYDWKRAQEMLGRNEF